MVVGAKDKKCKREVESGGVGGGAEAVASISSIRQMQAGDVVALYNY